MVMMMMTTTMTMVLVEMVMMVEVEEEVVEVEEVVTTSMRGAMSNLKGPAVLPVTVPVTVRGVRCALSGHWQAPRTEEELAAYESEEEEGGEPLVTIAEEVATTDGAAVTFSPG